MEAVLVKLRENNNNTNKLTSTQLLAFLLSWKMKGKGHTRFVGKSQLLQQCWEKVKDTVVILIEDPGEFVPMDTETVPSIEDTALGRHHKKKEADAISHLTEMTDVEFQKLLQARMEKKRGAIEMNGSGASAEDDFDASVLENAGVLM